MSLLISFPYGQLCCGESVIQGMLRGGREETGLLTRGLGDRHGQAQGLLGKFCIRPHRRLQGQAGIPGVVVGFTGERASTLEPCQTRALAGGVPRMEAEKQKAGTRVRVCPSATVPWIPEKGRRPGV